MYLNKLVVESLELTTKIREISFKKGLNLIVDEGKNQHSGNDIGKTTFLRSIDFCLGSMSDELYVDRDEKKENEDVKKFLISNKISFTLYVGDKIEIDDSTFVLKRYFSGETKNGKPTIVQSINGEELKVREYTDKLNEIFFQYSGKPSFRDLIPKFIREDKNSVDSPLKYLGDYKSNSDYNAVHLLLFGFKNSDALENRVELQSQLKTFANKSSVYIDDFGQKNSIEAELKVKYRKLEKLSHSKKILQQKIADVSNLDTDIDTLNYIVKKINTINTKIIDTELTIENISKSIKRLISERVKIDANIIKHLYKEANLYSDSLHKKFEDVLEFHNKMIDNKIVFAEKSMSKYHSDLSDLHKERNHYFEEYSIEKNFVDNDLFIELEEIDKLIITLSSEIIEKENVFEKLNQIESSSIDINQQLKEILITIEKAEDLIKKNIDMFNLFYEDYSYRLYNEEQFLSIGKELSDPFQINNKQNSGSGKKKAYIAAFDLAYSAFLTTVDYNYPKFSAIDLVEVIDTPQLKTLFQIANSIDCQFIIPTLKSKINNIDEDLQYSEILSLSETNKFFRF